MGVVPFTTTGPDASVVFRRDEFDSDRRAILILNAEQAQFQDGDDCNATYDLRVGDIYKDHRVDYGRQLGPGESIELLPGTAVIIQTEEEVQFPKHLFGHILPRVSLLEHGIANTPSKVDPGYQGHLLITAFNHGKRTEKLTRGAPFCSLHLLTVEDGIRPYNKAAKQIGGRPHVSRWEHLRDRAEVNQIWITLGIFVVAVFGLFLSLYAVLHSNSAAAPNAPPQVIKPSTTQLPQ